MLFKMSTAQPRRKIRVINAVSPPGYVSETSGPVQSGVSLETTVNFSAVKKLAARTEQNASLQETGGQGCPSAKLLAPGIDLSLGS
jgi:hypothetical protein